MIDPKTSMSISTGWIRATEVTVVGKDTLVLTLPGTEAQPTFLRYAYDDAPSIFTGTGLAVFNGEGLPASPGLWNVSRPQSPRSF